jgi:hypothetical protein
LRVAVDLETPQRWKAVWRRWRSLWGFGKSLSSATSEALSNFYRDNHEVLDSELITNTPPVEKNSFSPIFGCFDRDHRRGVDWVSFLAMAGANAGLNIAAKDSAS